MNYKNPPVFARPYSVDDSRYESSATLYFHEAQDGISLRDYLASKIIEGLLARNNIGYTFEEYAERAYNQADAMLIERLKPSKSTS